METPAFPLSLDRRASVETASASVAEQPPCKVTLGSVWGRSMEEYGGVWRSTEEYEGVRRSMKEYIRV